MPVKPEVWAWREPTGSDTRSIDGSWAYTPDTAHILGQHDLRGDLQPDHHRTEAIPGAGVPPGRSDPRLRPGGGQSQPPARDRLDGQPLPRRPELRHRPAVEALLSLRPGAGGTARRASASSASTTGTAWAPRSSSTSRTGSPASGKARDRGRQVVATSFALLFLAKGRAPVLVNKLRHGPRGDWNNDPDDVRNLVAVVSRDWKNLLTWQVVDPAIASVADLLQAPIVFFNGHKVPELNAQAKQNLRDYVEQGGLPLRRRLLLQPRVRHRASSSS